MPETCRKSAQQTCQCCLKSLSKRCVITFFLSWFHKRLILNANLYKILYICEYVPGCYLQLPETTKLLWCFVWSVQSSILPGLLLLFWWVIALLCLTYAVYWDASLIQNPYVNMIEQNHIGNSVIRVKSESFDVSGG